MEDLIGDLTAVPQPVEVKLFSDNPTQLGALANDVAALLREQGHEVAAYTGATETAEPRASKASRTTR